MDYLITDLNLTQDIQTQYIDLNNGNNVTAFDLLLRLNIPVINSWSYSFYDNKLEINTVQPLSPTQESWISTFGEISIKKEQVI